MPRPKKTNVRCLCSLLKAQAGSSDHHNSGDSLHDSTWTLRCKGSQAFGLW